MKKSNEEVFTQNFYQILVLFAGRCNARRIGELLSVSYGCCYPQNQLSGYLLRKFKNSNGWQKLWVVFTNFCLFFYKSFEVEWRLRHIAIASISHGHAWLLVNKLFIN